MAPRTSYDEVPYVSRPFRQTHPDRLCVLGRLLGMQPAPVESCRVLELGCASGGNLIPMAVGLPGSSFLGVDLSQEQVSDGQARIASLGITNVELRHANILEVEAGWGPFDIIICHGVFSWVPRPVQDHILELCGSALAPQGLAYVSYNTYPGWRMRSMIRDMMIYHARQLEDPEPDIQVAEARKLLDFMAGEVPTENNAYGILLQRELELLRNCDDSYLYHEHLEDHNEPLYLHEFVGRLEGFGLRFLGDAGFGNLTSTLFPDLIGEGLARDSDQWLRIEQYRDFVANRLFRSSLLARREIVAEHRPSGLDLAGLWISFRGDPQNEEPDLYSDAEELFETHAGGGVGSANPATKVALVHLRRAWPQALLFEDLWTGVTEELRAAPGFSGQLSSAEDLGDELLGMFAHGLLELRQRRLPHVIDVCERPVASPLVRQQSAAGQDVVTSLRHELHLVANLDRHILQRLDGTRDLDAIADALVEVAQAGGIEVTEDDLPVSSPERLREIFADFVPNRLELHAHKALLLG